MGALSQGADSTNKFNEYDKRVWPRRIASAHIACRTHLGFSYHIFSWRNEATISVLIKAALAILRKVICPCWQNSGQLAAPLALKVIRWTTLPPQKSKTNLPQSHQKAAMALQRRSLMTMQMSTEEYCLLLRVPIVHIGLP